MTLNRIFKIFFLIIFSIVQIQCSGGSDGGSYLAPNQVVVDSENDRVFIAQIPQEIIALVASTLDGLGDQPIVNEDDNPTIYDLMPSVVTGMAAYANGTTTRLFIQGGLVDESGHTVLNRILVLDFDGTSFSEADFSPIILSDGDDGTNETGNSFAGMTLDQENSTLYITDATAGLLYVISAVDGTPVTGPMTINGQPQQMSLDGGRLYICNSTTNDADQVVTVVDVSDFSTTAIDLDVPCDLIAVKSNDNGTVLIVKSSVEQKVLLRSVDTTTFADSSPIAAETDSGFTDGELTSGLGISSSIGGLTLTLASDGNLYAYLSELDGNIEFLTFASDLSTYNLETLLTSALNITRGGVLSDAGGDDLYAFLVAETGALIRVEVGTSSVSVDD